VGSANGGDARSVARDGKPVVDRRADLAPLHGRLARTMVPGDEEDEAFSRMFRPLERKVDRPPCTVEAVSVEIDDAVGLKRP
jgi:hypothetical protein